MLNIAGWIVSALTSVFAFLVKHPFVAKMMIFGFFVLAIHRFIAFLLSLVKPYVIDNTILNLACYFGLISALSLFLSIIIAGFGAKQLLGFMKTT